ncbi:MAG: glycoside hydrolase family 2 TIM barrel-domain containing protein [bacterium]|jgi:beta-glucuronidase|nr:glycoside hydrolase family 2 TIM barrel-domain containing protein [bacterium]
MKSKLVLLVLWLGFTLSSVFAGGDIRSLDGAWAFTLDLSNRGQTEGWYQPDFDRSGWRTVTVPHTWNVEPGNEEFFGVAWYVRSVTSDPAWKDHFIDMQFDAVYRDATVWVNGQQVKEHTLSGWTPFSVLFCPASVDRPPLNTIWNYEGANTIAVRVDNQFSPTALPYLNSFDWANDGGMIRSTRLVVIPKTGITSHVLIDAQPTPDFSAATLRVRADGWHLTGTPWDLQIFGPNGDLVLHKTGECTAPAAENTPNSTRPLTGWPELPSIDIAAEISQPILWHFDSPNLYTLQLRTLRDGAVIHEKVERFGIRRIEVKNGFYYLNGEPMRLMGLEWMPGSDPRHGMAESPEAMREILRDMKNLNVLITRFHWQQDKAVFDFMDQEGMLTQEEVPSWGGQTMEGDTGRAQEIHTQEMITAHYNHPSIYAWGLGNELGEMGKPFAFIHRGRDLAHRWDPTRPHTYASNGLQSEDIAQNASQYASSLVDFIEWNDYWESWYGGTVEDVKANLARLRLAFPDKSIVISEYGLCECNPKNPSGDQRRIEILKTHTDLYRQSPNVAGAIFFDYNDYRTHIGDKGQFAFKQRVHGVVDLFNRPKPSWEALRKECSPIKAIDINDPVTQLETTLVTIRLMTRALETDLPAYTLRGYLLTWIAYNSFNQPIGTGQRVLPDLAPGSDYTDTIDWVDFEDLSKIKVEIFRPTGYSVHEETWEK